MKESLQILLIEDNPGDARIVKEYLKVETIPTYNFYTAASLSEGLQTLSEKDIDIILADLGLPDSQGIETFYRLAESVSGVPIILLTGQNDNSLGLEAVKMGAEDYLVKGQVDQQLLVRSINYAIERKKANNRQKVISRILQILNRPNEWHEIIKDILFEIKEFSGIEAAAIRIQKEDDYPYIDTFGFSPEFIETEKSLCIKDLKGNIVFGSDGKPLLACTCGNVLSEKTDAQYPFYTKAGSFWTNSTTEMINNTTGNELGKQVRNRCNRDGFESVALIPVISGSETIGLIQLNDKRTGCFTLEQITFYEEIASTIGIAYKRVQSTRLITESEERFKVAAEAAGEWVWEVNEEGLYTYSSPLVEKLLGYTPEEIVGKKHFYDLFKEDVKEQLKEGALHMFNQKLEIKDSENANIHKNGTIVILKTCARPIVDSAGNFIGYRGADNDITERKRAEESLIESENKFRLLADYTFDWEYWINPKGEYIYLSPSCERITGFTPEELKSNPNILYDIVGSDYLEAVQKHYQDENNGNSPFYTMEFPIVNKNGEEIWLEHNCTPIFDEEGIYIGKRGNNRDITERKKAEESVKSERKMLRTLIDNLPDSIYVKDEKGRKLIANPADVENIGATSEAEVLGKTDLELFPDEIGTRGYSEDKIILETGNPMINKEENFIKANGSETWLLTSKIPFLNEFGKISGLVGIGHDISKRKKSDADLKSALEKAQESDRLKSAFLANISHEIRTPMNGILGFAELLKMPGLTGGEQLEYLNIIKKSGDRMLNIISEIVDISKIESGQMMINLTDANINEQIEFVHNLFNHEAEAKGLQLTCQNGLPAKESIIKTDREKIYAILINLVKNAIKYTDQGSIEFGYNQKSVVPSSSRAVVQSELEFYVKDTGIGIPSDRQQFIFERFIQADISDKRAFQGAGLGLSIAKAYIEMLGGNLWVESEEGKGSAFFFTIPYLPFQKEKLTDSVITSPGEKTKQINRLKILVVEDDETSVILLMEMLKEYSRETLLADTGIEAIETCRNNPDIDLVLMDIKMHGMNGYEATRQIRQFNKDVVIIAQTAFNLTGDREKSIEAGCNDHIPKPIQREKLLTIIQTYYSN